MHNRSKSSNLQSRTALTERESHNELRRYRNCLDLQTRLLSLPGFAIYSEALLDSPDPVVCIRQVFRSGIPLCHLFNLLPTRLYPRIDLDLATLHNESYAQRLAIAQFALRVHHAFKCDHFTLSDILLSELTSGFDKVLNAVSIVVDHLSLTEVSQGPKSLKHYHSSSSNRLLPQNNDCSGKINDLLTSERNYVAKMETLKNFSNALAATEILDSESISLIFPKKMFVFARKFRIQLECIAQLPMEDQDWGTPFVSHAMDLTMNLRIHCVNWILLKPALADFDMGSLQIPGFQATSESVNTLVSAPLERLSYYHKFLEKFISLSASTNHKNLKEQRLGVTCIQQVMDTIQKAQKKATSDQVCETLKTRIADWQGLSIDSLGQLILEDHLLTRRNDILQNFHVFLFENALMLCDEILPPLPTNNSRIGRRRVSSVSTPPSKDNTLYIKDHISIRAITNASRTEFRRLQDDGLRLFFELTLFMGGHVLSLLYPDHDDMQRWFYELQPVQQRKEETKHKGINGSQSQDVVRPSTRLNIPTQRKRASSYSGTLTDIENGPLPESLLSLPLIVHRSAFVKLHFGGNSFVLLVPLPVEFEDLLDRIDKKLRFLPEWTLEGTIITHTSANGHVVSIGPTTPLETMFQEGLMVSLRVKKLRKRTVAVG
ncbi:hypothetical protein J3R30DRAFT_3707582 [Lentinula aciculospora]|uniref:PH domain-containing protein n=1 Tax=Lentinula aciculospora TaxID=153920 RepID=A0A9W9DJN8_9AGAR|nr:hypothetical protein J3R30DRAFT_3707582 [Lentinula aciculospora]